MVKFNLDISRTERQELCQGLDWIGIGYAFDQLVNGAHGVRSNVGTRVVEDHIEHHVEERFREMDADLAECARDGIYKLDCIF